VAGAIGGAIIGSIIGGPRNAGAGLLIGGATGAVVGSAADANAQAQAQQTQAQLNQNAAAGRARADSYRRAISACLQGRGYTIS
jgi:outer membrane lipoprotein SlyB